MRGIVAALIASVAIGACGAPRPGPQPGHLERENQITALWTQIREWRREAHMPLAPAAHDVYQWVNRPLQEAKRSCGAEEPVMTKCDDVCSIADNICDNAEAICNLADELGKGDDYAQGKCADAKASCREAKQRCCNCNKEASPTSGAIF